MPYILQLELSISEFSVLFNTMLNEKSSIDYGSPTFWPSSISARDHVRFIGVKLCTWLSKEYLRISIKCSNLWPFHVSHQILHSFYHSNPHSMAYLITSIIFSQSVNDKVHCTTTASVQVKVSLLLQCSCSSIGTEVMPACMHANGTWKTKPVNCGWWRQTRETICRQANV
jgi:hypothetical protein